MSKIGSRKKSLISERRVESRLQEKKGRDEVKTGKIKK